MSEKLWVTLKSAGNIDFNQNPDQPLPGVPTRKVEVDSLAAASKTCRTYIKRYELGGGNWVGGLIVNGAGEEVGRVGYNGVVWPPGGMHMGDDEPLYSPAKKKAEAPVDPYAPEAVIIDVPDFGKVSLTGWTTRGTIKSVARQFFIDDQRIEFITGISYSLDGSEPFTHQGFNFHPDGFYEKNLTGPSAQAAQAQICAIVEEYLATPAAQAVLLRNMIKSEQSQIDWNKRRVASLEDEILNHKKTIAGLEEHVSDLAVALQDVLDGPAPQGMRP